MSSAAIKMAYATPHYASPPATRAGLAQLAQPKTSPKTLAQAQRRKRHQVTMMRSDAARLIHSWVAGS